MEANPDRNLPFMRSLLLPKSKLTSFLNHQSPGTGTVFVTHTVRFNIDTLKIRNMGTIKKLIGVGVVTGVVVYAYFRSLSNKLNHNSLPEGEKANAQLDFGNTTY